LFPPAAAKTTGQLFLAGKFAILQNYHVGYVFCSCLHVSWNAGLNLNRSVGRLALDGIIVVDHHDLVRQSLSLDEHCWIRPLLQHLLRLKTITSWFGENAKILENASILLPLVFFE
jgi:hypothetical protein